MYMGHRGKEVYLKWLNEESELAGYDPKTPVVLCDHKIAEEPTTENPSGEHFRVYRTMVYAKERSREDKETTDAGEKVSSENEDDGPEKESKPGIPSAHQGDESSIESFSEVSPRQPPDGQTIATTHPGGFETLCSKMEDLMAELGTATVGPTDYSNSWREVFDKVVEPSGKTGSMVWKWDTVVPVTLDSASH
jgi:hypothetical protein